MCFINVLNYLCSMKLSFFNLFFSIFLRVVSAWCISVWYVSCMNFLLYFSVLFIKIFKNKNDVLFCRVVFVCYISVLYSLCCIFVLYFCVANKNVYQEACL